MRAFVRPGAVLVLLAAAAGRAGAQDAQAFADGVAAANKKLKAAGYRLAQPLPALLAAERHFLESQDRLLNRDCAELAALLEDDKGDPADRKARLDRLLERMARDERDALAPLQQAYARFVAEQRPPKP